MLEILTNLRAGQITIAAEVGTGLPQAFNPRRNKRSANRLLRFINTAAISAGDDAGWARNATCTWSGTKDTSALTYRAGKVAFAKKVRRLLQLQHLAEPFANSTPLACQLQLKSSQSPAG